MKKERSQITVEGKLDPHFQSWARSVSVGERLRWLLETRKMKQTELAAIIKRTQASISNIVTDSTRRPNAETLLRVAAALQCSADWLVRGEGHPFEINVVGAADEKRLLEEWRKLDDQAKSAILAAVHAMQK